MSEVNSIAAPGGEDVALCSVKCTPIPEKMTRNAERVNSCDCNDGSDSQICRTNSDFGCVITEGYTQQPAVEKDVNNMPEENCSEKDLVIEDLS